MWLKYSLDKDFLPAHIHIMPSTGEDPSNLHNISSRLIIDNPAVQFTTDAKAGLYNQYSDEDYAKMLAIVKRLSLLFYQTNGKTCAHQINLFELTVRLLYEYMLNMHSESSRII